jgi:predicted small integral membrane protein
LAFLVEKNIFEASYVTFFNTNYKFVPLLSMDTKIKLGYLPSKEE